MKSDYKNLLLKVVISCFAIWYGCFCFAREEINEPNRGKDEEVQNHKAAEDLSTAQLRMLASISLGTPDKVVDDVLKILTGDDWNLYLYFSYEDILYIPLSYYPEAKIAEVFRHYGLEIKPKQWKILMDECQIIDLIYLIAYEKTDGLTSGDAWECLSAMLEGLIQEQQQNWQKDQLELMKLLYQRVEYCLQRDPDVMELLYLKFNGLSKGLDRALYELKLSKLITDNLDYISNTTGDSIGGILPAGWPGHFIVLEVRPLEDGYYEICVANAGCGAERFHYSPTEVSPHAKQYMAQTVNVYRVYGKNRLVSFLNSVYEIMFNFIIEDGEICIKDQSKSFYHLFHGCKQLLHYGVLLRPVQYMGNCAIRSPEEMIFKVLQRNGEAGLANDLQSYIINYYQSILTKSYPALRERVEQQKALIKLGLVKPEIKPIDEEQECEEFIVSY